MITLVLNMSLFGLNAENLITECIGRWGLFVKEIMMTS